MNSPKYSIIVPTYNRKEELKELLASLELLSAVNNEFELVIVDDGSTDSTAEYIRQFESTFSISYFQQENQGPGAARNLGMKHARGDYFIFVDSDCLIPSGYLSHINNYIAEHNPDAFGGPDTYHPSFSPLLKAINYSMTSFIGTGGTRGHKKSVAKFYPRSFNMGFKRSVFETIGGFGGLRHGQDMDYSARIYQAGFQVGLIPEAFVYHKRRTSLKKFFKQIYNWGIARINLSNLHKGFLKPVHFIPSLLITIGPLLLILGILIKSLNWTLYILGAGLGVIIFIAIAESFKEYKSIKISLLSVVTLLTQIVAYGLGVISGLIQKIFLNRKESKGFSKNYYK